MAKPAEDAQRKRDAVVNRTTAGTIFEGQVLHLALLGALVAGATAIAYGTDGFLDGAWLGVSAESWFWAGIILPVLHQGWVWFWWRLELHRGWASRHFGAASFRIYAAGFVVLVGLRIFALAGAGLADRGSLVLDPLVGWTLAALLLLPGAWLLYSITRYFGFVHALGADHFFEEHRQHALCREGIFRYVPNAMYTVGFLALWAIAFAFASRVALLLAALNHAYIWVHYLCTEKPDMRRIYGA